MASNINMYLSFSSNATSRDTDWLRAVLMCYTDWQIILLSQIYSCICHTLTILGERLMSLNALITSPVLTVHNHHSYGSPRLSDFFDLGSRG